MEAMDKYTENLQRKIKKQPQWIQDHIARLEKEVKRYRELLTKTEEGRTSICWTDYTNEKYLPDRGVVQFRMANGNIEVALKDGKLELRANDIHSAALVILPAYSNMFYATIAKTHLPESEE